MLIYWLAGIERHFLMEQRPIGLRSGEECRTLKQVASIGSRGLHEKRNHRTGFVFHTHQPASCRKSLVQCRISRSP
jgi:hypothetical protein